MWQNNWVAKELEVASVVGTQGPFSVRSLGSPPSVTEIRNAKVS